MGRGVISLLLLLLLPANGIRIVTERKESAAVLAAEEAPIDCAKLVPDPVDTPPLRSAQVVHSALARKFRDKEIAEIGTRAGDGMNCFAQVAKAATGIEYDPEYCGDLKKRASGLSQSVNKSYAVKCGAFPEAFADAEIYTWFNGGENMLFLHELRRLQTEGKVRPDAKVVVLFENSTEEMILSKNPDYSFIESQNWISESQQVDYDETAFCEQWLKKHCKECVEGKSAKLAEWKTKLQKTKTKAKGWADSKSSSKVSYNRKLHSKNDCKRAKGSLVIVTLPLSKVALEKIECHKPEGPNAQMLFCNQKGPSS